jgi:hypothetical protein
MVPRPLRAPADGAVHMVPRPGRRRCRVGRRHRGSCPLSVRASRRNGKMAMPMATRDPTPIAIANRLECREPPFITPSRCQLLTASESGVQSCGCGGDFGVESDDRCREAVFAPLGLTGSASGTRPLGGSSRRTCRSGCASTQRGRAGCQPAAHSDGGHCSCYEGEAHGRVCARRRINDPLDDPGADGPGEHEDDEADAKSGGACCDAVSSLIGGDAHGVNFWKKVG